MEIEPTNEHDRDLPEAADEALRVVGTGGSTQHVQVHNHGQDSVVAVVDNSIVFKFPRTAAAATRLDLERLVLNRLSPDPLGLQVPTVLGVGEEPRWIALNCIPGDNLSYAQIRGLDHDAQVAIGMKLGAFMHEIHSRLDVNEVTKARTSLGVTELDTPWSQYFEEVVGMRTHRTRSQDEIAKQTYQKWLSAGRSRSKVVVHDDLHADNLLFCDGALAAVLDFGETTIGSREQELRHTLWMSELVSESAARTYEQLSGIAVNRELIRLWSVMQELAAFTDHDVGHASHERARSNLQRWFPDVDWSGHLR